MSDTAQPLRDFDTGALPSPIEKVPAWRDHWPEFEEVMKAKLQQGHEEYGDGSFDLPLRQLVDEVEQEVVDIVGWSFIQWTRLQRLKRMIGLVEEKTE